MMVDGPLAKLRACARTDQDQRDSTTVALNPDECSLLIAEIDCLRVIYRTYLAQRNEALIEVRAHREIANEAVRGLLECRKVAGANP